MSPGLLSSPYLCRYLFWIFFQHSLHHESVAAGPDLGLLAHQSHSLLHPPRLLAAFRAGGLTQNACTREVVPQHVGCGRSDRRPCIARVRLSALDSASSKRPPCPRQLQQLGRQPSRARPYGP